MNQHLQNIQNILDKHKDSYIPWDDDRKLWENYNVFDGTLAKNDKELLRSIFDDCERFFRGWLYHQKDPDQILIKQKTFEIIIDIFSNNLKSMEESKFYPEYKAVKDRILEDMLKNRNKYLSSPWGGEFL